MIRAFALALLALAVPSSAMANGADLPAEVVLHAFVKQEDKRAVLLLRVPLDLLASFGLPKRGPGYLDLGHIDERLQRVAAAAARQVELRAEGATLAPVTREARISLLSDPSFRDYETALAHVRGPRLPADTDLFWNQGFFDALLEYPLASGAPLSIRVNVAPELGARLKVQLDFLPAGKPRHRFVLTGGSGWIALEPRWHEAALLFARAGFAAAATQDRFIVLVCLIAPFRALRGALVPAAAWIVLQTLALVAAPLGGVGSMRGLGSLVDGLLAAVIFLLAVGNLAAPSLRLRLAVSAMVGALAGLALAPPLDEAWQFSGTHPFGSAAAFHIGAALATLAGAALAWTLLRQLLDRIFGGPLDVIVVSAVAGHAGWHWMIDRSHELGHALEHARRSDIVGIAGWLLLALLLGGAGFLLPRAWFADGRIPTLLSALKRD